MVARKNKMASLEIPSQKQVLPKGLGSVHTMPTYFRNAKSMHKPRSSRSKNGFGNSKVAKPSKSRNTGLFVIIFIVLLVILTIIGIFFYLSYQKNNNLESDREQELTQELERQRKEAEERARLAAESQKNKEDSQQEILAEQSLRDKQRILDIHKIQVALEAYFDSQSRYPDSVLSGGKLSVEQETFLELIPSNPTPGGSLYSYVVAPSDGLSYTLSFTLEIGEAGLLPGIVTVTSENQLREDGTLVAISTKRKGLENTTVLTSLDTDLDGLTDIEERLFGTNKDKFDSDDDTYSDKQELINLYNPSGLAPIRLIDSGDITEYTNDIFKYSIYYHNEWVVKPLDESNQEVIFTSTTGEFIEVLIEDNKEDLSITEWFEQQFPQIPIEKVLPVSTNNEVLVGLRSLDRRTVYFIHEGKVIIITHNVGNKEEIDYTVTFEVMVKSFRIENIKKEVLKEVASEVIEVVSDVASETSESVSEVVSADAIEPDEASITE